MWSEHVVPRLTDRALSVGQVMKQRERTCAGLSGRLLEIGFGSGLNVEKYPDAVIHVDAVEPSDVGWSLSESRREASAVTITRSGLDGQHLDAADAGYDSVLCTFSLCTIPDPALALREMRRALRPGGTLHFLEHGLAPEHAVAQWQRRLEPVQRRAFAGCHLTRDPLALVASAGFAVDDVEQLYLPGPRVGRAWGYVTRARATLPA